MINNFEDIKLLLRFEDENEFYFLQIIQRKKEHPNLGRNNRLIKAYYIHSIEQLDKYTEEIIGLCDKFNARAYIHLNRRNSKVVAFEMMELLATNLKLNQFNQLSKLYNTVCGNHHSDKDKSWILDIDEKDGLYINQMIGVLNEIEPVGPKVIHCIETKNGYHLITKPFNSKVFIERYPEIQIHRNNPTILYTP
jgi:hypothetical protein